MSAKQKCCKCHRPGKYKWEICANKDEWVCEKHDEELNLIALKWRYPKSWKRRIEAYRRIPG